MQNEGTFPTPREPETNHSTPVLGAVAEIPASGSAPGAGRKSGKKGVPRYRVENYSYKFRESVIIGEYVRFHNAKKAADEEFFWGIDQVRVWDMETQEEVYFRGRAGA